MDKAFSFFTTLPGHITATLTNHPITAAIIAVACAAVLAIHTRPTR